jgi:hypothetical protein
VLKLRHRALDAKGDLRRGIPCPPAQFGGVAIVGTAKRLQVRASEIDVAACVALAKATVSGP